MSFVPHLSKEEAPILSKNFYGKNGASPLTKTLAHVPTLLQQTMPFISRALGASAIDFRTKEIVILRTSVLQQCLFCINTHSAVALQASLLAEEILELHHGQQIGTAYFSQKERIMIAWTDAISKDPNMISSSLREQMQRYFSAAEIVELTMLVSATVMLNKYCTALGLPPSEECLALLASKGLAYTC